MRLQLQTLQLHTTHNAGEFGMFGPWGGCPADLVCYATPLLTCGGSSYAPVYLWYQYERRGPWEVVSGELGSLCYTIVISLGTSD